MSMYLEIGPHLDKLNENFQTHRSWTSARREIEVKERSLKKAILLLEVQIIRHSCQVSPNTKTVIRARRSNVSLDKETTFGTS